jgi:hypothetical protein
MSFDARKMNALTLRHAHIVPAILANAGENAATKLLEFFAARIPNFNTREACAQACARFPSLKRIKSAQPMFCCLWPLLYLAVCFVYQVQAAAPPPTHLSTAEQEGDAPGIVLVKSFTPGSAPKELGPCNAKIDDTIELLVQRLEEWLTLLNSAKIHSSKSGEELVDEQVPHLRLFINGKPMQTILVSEWFQDRMSWDWHKYMPAFQKDVPRHWLRFRLRRDGSDPQSRADWDEVLKTPGWWAQMDLTVGFYYSDNNTAEALTTWVRRDDTNPIHQFIFNRIVWDTWLIAGLVLLLAAFLVFIYLAFRSPIIREPTLPIRDDGLPPVSLGRCQMAFWFFLTAIAFFFLWLVTGRGDINTIHPTVLTLIGISAGTAFGAAVIANNTANPLAAAEPPKRNYPEEIKSAKEKLLAAKVDRARVDSQNANLIAQTNTAMVDAFKELNKLQQEFKAYKRLHRNQFFMDLLSENDATAKRQIISFHRFQIVVWTLVLGIVFVSDVINKLVMTNFDSTLLVLMGISAGTYLGFKFPPGKQDVK